jgi:hypothetical protein
LESVQFRALCRGDYLEHDAVTFFAAHALNGFVPFTVVVYLEYMRAFVNGSTQKRVILYAFTHHIDKVVEYRPRVVCAFW